MECDICSNWIDDKFGHNAEPKFKAEYSSVMKALYVSNA